MPQTLPPPFRHPLSFLLPLFALGLLASLPPAVASTPDRAAFAASETLECLSPVNTEFKANAISSLAPVGAVQRWSDPNTWPNRRVPRAGDRVVIGAGQTVLLDESTAALGGLTIEGVLRFDDRPVNLTADWILIQGDGALLEVGTAATPYRHKAFITLTAQNRNENVAGDGVLGTGTKFIITRLGGSLSMHGVSREKVSWTVLDAHANPGDRVLTLDRAVDWEPGDQIVVAASGFDPREAEQLTVQSVSGNRVTVSESLQHRHFGQIQTIEGRRIDQRAEVGLLSRNIVIEGDATSEDATRYSGYRVGFGGHMMFMEGGTVQLEGIELRNMGQTGRSGRYTMHWHYAGARYSDYVRNVSIHRSFQRAINIHKTQGVTIENNVAYAITSHAYVFAEDGDEYDNRFTDNLAVLNWALEEQDYAFPYRNNPRLSQQGEERAGLFWGRNPHNELIGNRAAGSYLGHGFFYDQQFIKGFSPLRQYLHQNEPIVFTDNVAHSIFDYPARGSFASYGPEARGSGLFVGFREGPYPLVFGPDFLAYKVSHSGIWIEEENETVQGATVTDSGIGASQTFGKLKDLFVVGNTANDIGGPIPATARHLGAAGGLNITDQSQKRADEDLRRVQVENATFVDVEPAAVSIEWDRLEPGSEVSGLTFIRSKPLFFFDKMQYGGIYDADGSLSGFGRPGMIYGEGDREASTDRCEWMGSASAWFCPDDGQLAPPARHVLVEDAQPGVAYTFWKGTFEELPDVDGLGNSTETGTASNFDIDALPVVSGHTVRFEGFLEVPETGVYRFVLDAKEGGALHIGGQTVVWGSRPGQPLTHEGYARLRAGYHPITVDHYKKLSNPIINVQWEGPGFGLRTIRDNELVRGTAVEPPPDEGDGDNGSGGGENQPPAVEIVSPQDGMQIPAGQSGTVVAEASDPDGEVTEVIFYVNGQEQHTDRRAPWRWSANGVPPGSYTLTAVAVDNEGARSTSVPVNITASNSARAGGASSQALPTEFAIDDVYPNPFNPATTVQVAMPDPGDYDITVFDVAGRKVMEVLLLDQEPGVAPVRLDMSGHASGLYILQARQAETGRVLTERLTLLK